MSFVTSLFGGGGAQSGSQDSQQPVQATGIDIQSSVYGIPIPILIGSTRHAGNLIEINGLVSYGQYSNSGGGGGGKGFGGAGGGQVTLQGYNYYANVAFGLCEGRINNVFRVWQDDSSYNNGTNVYWAPASGTIPNNYFWSSEAYSGLAYVSNTSFFLGSSPNIPNMNFETSSVHSGLAFYSNIGTITDGFGEYTYAWGALIKQGMVQGYGLYDAYTVIVNNGWATGFTNPNTAYDADPAMAVADLLCNPVWGAGYPAAHLGAPALQTDSATIPGGAHQVTTKYSLAYAYNVNVKNTTTGQLMTCVASSPATGQYSFNDTTGVYTFAAADAGNTVSIRYAYNTGLAELSVWAYATSMWVSCYYDSQTTTSSILDDLCNALHVIPVYSSGFLYFKPMAFSNASGNGYTWAAPATPLYNLTDDDFVNQQGHTASQSGQSSTDPLIMTRSRQSDQINDFRLEWLDRLGNQYAPAIAEAKDQANIDVFGLRPPQSLTTHYFCNAAAAYNSAAFMVQGQQVRNQYSYTVDERYCLLDVMDLITLTDSNNSAVTAQPVQITEVTENDDGTLSMIAVEFPLGVTQAPLFTFQTGSGTQINTGQDPGSVNTPIVFAAPVGYAQIQGLEMWVAVSGSASQNWGGAHAFASTDNATYKYIGQINVPARTGLTTTLLPVNSDPDTSDSVTVNLTSSNGQLASGTQSDADLLNTLCLIRGSNGDEYISYESASLIGANIYTLGTYLRRGQLNTNIVSHPVGSPFIRIDVNSIFRVPYTPNQIGQTIYMKFTSFNTFGAGEQNIASVTAYPLVVPQPPLPPNVTGFIVQQFNTAVTFKWNAVNYPLIALSGYYIGFAPQGTTDWSQFTMLTIAQGGDGTEMTNADVPPGTWTFAIRAANIANTPGTTNGLSPLMTTADLTVQNNTNNVSNVEQSPAWEGMTAGFAHDGFSSLIPHGTIPVGGYPALASPPTPTLASVASGLAFAATVFCKITYVTAFGETLPSNESSIAITSGHAVQVTSPPAYNNATGYNIYLSTTTGTETQQNGTPINIGTNWTQSINVFTGASQPTHNSTGFEPYGDDFVPNVTPLAYYMPPTVDAGLDLQLRIFFTSSEVQGPLQGGTAGTGISYGVDAWTSIGSDSDVFQPWTIGSVTARYVRTMLLYQPIVQDQVSVITQFLPSINEVTSEVDSQNIAIAPGGTTVSFGRSYVTKPFVTATVEAGTALFASVVSITTTQCTVHVWNTSGVDVGGTVNLQITGQ